MPYVRIGSQGEKTVSERKTAMRTFCPPVRVIIYTEAKPPFIHRQEAAYEQYFEKRVDCDLPGVP